MLSREGGVASTTSCPRRRASSIPRRPTMESRTRGILDTRLRGYDGSSRAGTRSGACRTDAQARLKRANSIPSAPQKAQPGSLPRKRSKGLPPGHDCCVFATLGEDLTLITGSSHPRRFLATPLHEIIFHNIQPARARESEANRAGETGS
jgi:hypothetical protein